MQIKVKILKYQKLNQHQAEDSTCAVSRASAPAWCARLAPRARPYASNKILTQSRARLDPRPLLQAQEEEREQRQHVQRAAVQQHDARAAPHRALPPAPAPAPAPPAQQRAPGAVVERGHAGVEALLLPRLVARRRAGGEVGRADAGRRLQQRAVVHRVTAPAPRAAPAAAALVLAQQQLVVGQREVRQRQRQRGRGRRRRGGARA